MHQLKEQSKMMKEALLKGRLNEIGEILDYGFQQKIKMAHNISNSFIEDIYTTAKRPVQSAENKWCRWWWFYGFLLPSQ